MATLSNLIQKLFKKKSDPIILKKLMESDDDRTDREIISKRIKDLKMYAEMVKVVIEENETFQKVVKRTWHKRTIERNLIRLKELRTKIGKDKHSDQLQKYCNGIRGLQGSRLELFTQTGGMSVISVISECSIPGSILYDINWLEHFTVGEKFRIALRKEDPEILGQYLPRIISTIEKNIIPELLNHSEYKFYGELILTSIQLTNSKSYAASNLVLIPVIEGIVRNIAKLVFSNQNLNLTKNEVNEKINNFQSLEGLIQWKDWKNDIPINTVELVTIYSYVNESEVNDANKFLKREKIKDNELKELIKEFRSFAPMIEPYIRNDDIPDEILSRIKDCIHKINSKLDDMTDIRTHQSLINLRIRLHFLIRRYKEDRNDLIHGNIEPMNHQWKNYITLCVIAKIWDVRNEYCSIYN
jgi:hypothetical protein